MVVTVLERMWSLTCVTGVADTTIGTFVRRDGRREMAVAPAGAGGSGFAEYRAWSCVGGREVSMLLSMSVLKRLRRSRSPFEAVGTAGNVLSEVVGAGIERELFLDSASSPTSADGIVDELIFREW